MNRYKPLLICITGIILLFILGCSSITDVKYNSPEESIDACYKIKPENGTSGSVSFCLGDAAEKWADEKICFYINQTDSLEAAAFNTCIKKVAVIKNNISLCGLSEDRVFSSLTEFEIESCITHFAKAKKDSKYCGYIGFISQSLLSNTNRAQCKVSIDKDITVCGVLEREFERDGCYIYFSDLFKDSSACQYVKRLDDYYYCIAKANNNKETCLKIEDDDTRKLCIKYG